MLREIFSTQRKMRALELYVDGTGTAALSGPASNQASLVDNGTGDYTISFNQAYANTPLVLAASETADVVCQIFAKSASSCQIKCFKPSLSSGSASSPTVSEETASIDTQQGIVIWSNFGGVAGNSISYEQTVGATAGAEVVTVTNTAGAYKISVQVENGVSTAAQVATAIRADAEAANVISLQVSGAATAQAAYTEANLTGGVDAIAGSANSTQALSFAATDADFHLFIMGSDIVEKY